LIVLTAQGYTEGAAAQGVSAQSASEPPCPLAVRPRAGFIRRSIMISPEAVNQIESIKKRAGHLWRFL